MIEIFGWDAKIVCPPCLNSKRLCEARNKEYVFYDMGRDDETETQILHRTMFESRMKEAKQVIRGLPIVFIDDKYVGGFNELRAALM